MEKQIEIFLSYATPDQEKVLQVYTYLSNNGYSNVWIDCEKLLPGQNWDYEIQKNLRKADIIIIFLSKNSTNRRGYVQKEIKITLKYLEEKLEEDIYIIPVKLDEDINVPEQLKSLQWVYIESNNSLTKIKKSIDIQANNLDKYIPEQSVTVKNTHTTKRVKKEHWQGLPGYEFEIEIPVFHSSDFNKINEIGQIIEADFIKNLHECRSLKFEQDTNHYSWIEPEYRRTYIFNASYREVYQENNFLSIHYNLYWYGPKAAHPNQNYVTYNFTLEPLIRVTSLYSMFKKPSEALSILVPFIRSSVRWQKERRLSGFDDASQDEIDNDTTVSSHMVESELDENDIRNINEKINKWNQLSTFAFTNKGLIFSFDAYVVGSYAEGAYHVEVPYELFKDYLKKEYVTALFI
jgi:hypothetical protein